MELSEREKSILRYVIHQFILTASPVGSRNISKKYQIGLSPASIRNIMSDLEDNGFLGHPHTSAGRVPTDKGYRFYVDSLMDPPFLDQKEIDIIESVLDSDISDTDDLLKITSVILSRITNQLACVTYPKFENAVLQKVQIVSLSSTRILVVLSIKSGMVKTITLELNIEFDAKKAEIVQRLLNERLAGLTFNEIKDSFEERVKDRLTDEIKPVVRLFLDSADKIFADIKVNDKSFISGTKNILKQPEFEDHEQLQSVIELVEDKDIIIHIMDKKTELNPNNLSISIGRENLEDKLSNYSMVIKDYKVGGIHGTLGIIGPKRMEYSKTIAAVVYIAEMLSKELKKANL